MTAVKLFMILGVFGVFIGNYASRASEPLTEEPSCDFTKKFRKSLQELGEKVDKKMSDSEFSIEKDEMAAQEQSMFAMFAQNLYRDKELIEAANRMKTALHNDDSDGYRNAINDALEHVTKVYQENCLDKE